MYYYILVHNLCFLPSVSELDSFMFQTVGHEVLSLLPSALGGGIPLFRADLGGPDSTPSTDTGATYDPEAAGPGDEVEAMLGLIQRARTEVEFEAVCSGAILSDYQRVRVENV